MAAAQNNIYLKLRRLQKWRQQWQTATAMIELTLIINIILSLFHVSRLLSLERDPSVVTRKDSFWFALIAVLLGWNVIFQRFICVCTSVFIVFCVNEFFMGLLFSQRWKANRAAAYKKREIILLLLFITMFLCSLTSSWKWAIKCFYDIASLKIYFN